MDSGFGSMEAIPVPPDLEAVEEAGGYDSEPDLARVINDRSYVPPGFKWVTVEWPLENAHVASPPSWKWRILNISDMEEEFEAVLPPNGHSITPRCRETGIDAFIGRINQGEYLVARNIRLFGRIPDDMGNSTAVNKLTCINGPIGIFRSMAHQVGPARAYRLICRAFKEPFSADEMFSWRDSGPDWTLLPEPQDAEADLASAVIDDARSYDETDHDEDLDDERDRILVEEADRRDLNVLEPGLVTDRSVPSLELEVPAPSMSELSNLADTDRSEADVRGEGFSGILVPDPNLSDIQTSEDDDPLVEHLLQRELRVVPHGGQNEDQAGRNDLQTSVGETRLLYVRGRRAAMEELVVPDVDDQEDDEEEEEDEENHDDADDEGNESTDSEWYLENL